MTLVAVAMRTHSLRDDAASSPATSSPEKSVGFWLADRSVGGSGDVAARDWSAPLSVRAVPVSPLHPTTASRIWLTSVRRATRSIAPPRGGMASPRFARLGEGQHRIEPSTVCTFESAMHHEACFGPLIGAVIVDEAHHFGACVGIDSLDEQRATIEAEARGVCLARREIAPARCWAPLELQAYQQAALTARELPGARHRAANGQRKDSGGCGRSGAPKAGSVARSDARAAGIALAFCFAN